MTDTMLRRIEDFAKSHLPVTISKKVYVEDVTYLLQWVKRASDPMEHTDYFAPQIDTLTADLERARAEVADCKKAYGKLFNKNAAIEGALVDIQTDAAVHSSGLAIRIFNKCADALKETP